MVTAVAGRARAVDYSPSLSSLTLGEMLVASGVHWIVTDNQNPVLAPQNATELTPLNVWALKF